MRRERVSRRYTAQDFHSLNYPNASHLREE